MNPNEMSFKEYRDYRIAQDPDYMNKVMDANRRLTFAQNHEDYVKAYNDHQALINPRPQTYDQVIEERYSQTSKMQGDSWSQERDYMNK